MPQAGWAMYDITRCTIQPLVGDVCPLVELRAASNGRCLDKQMQVWGNTLQMRGLGHRSKWDRANGHWTDRDAQDNVVQVEPQLLKSACRNRLISIMVASQADVFVTLQLHTLSWTVHSDSLSHVGIITSPAMGTPACSSQPPASFLGGDKVLITRFASAEKCNIQCAHHHAHDRPAFRLLCKVAGRAL